MSLGAFYIMVKTYLLTYFRMLSIESLVLYPINGSYTRFDMQNHIESVPLCK